jgi:ATP-binding cassette subfamily B protein
MLASMSLLWHFFKRFLRYRGALLAGLLCIPAAQLADVGITLLIGNALDRVAQSEDTSYMPRVLGLLVGAAVLHSVFRFFQRWCIVVVSRRVEVDLKQELFDRLASLDFAFHDRSRSGDVVSRLTSDVENLRMFLGPGLMYTAGALVIVPISIGILMTLNSTLALTMLLPMASVALVMKLLTPRLHRHSLTVQESLGEISHRAQENFSGIRVVKGYDREDQQAGLFSSTSQDNRDNQVRLGDARGLTHAYIHTAFGATFAVILLLGGLAAIDRSLPLGDLFKFIDLTLKIFWPLIAMGWIAGMYPRAVVSAERVKELLDRSSAIQSGSVRVKDEEVEGELSFEGLGFTYPEAKRCALQGIDLHVPGGSTLGVVGPTGAGKTTLLEMVGRLHDAESGRLRLDGTDVRELNLDDLRRTLGYVPQDSFLFSEPFHENIRFGADEDLSDERVEELLLQSVLTEEVAAFPDGVQTLVGERGVTLSGGQRQRACIARALARDPRVLILDDCLSAVDSETEKTLIDHLQREGRGRTVLIAAHRLSTVARADQILVLTGAGAVEALGTHSELLSQAGWYRDTWNQQQLLQNLEDPA